MTRNQTSSSAWTYLAIVAAVAVVAVVALTGNFTGLEGASVHSGPADSFSSICTDNDDRNNYGKFGTVHLGTTKYYDYCQDEQFLKQWYCPSSTSKRTTKGYRCPNGCLNGVCK